MLSKYCSKAAVALLLTVTLAGWASAQNLAPVPQDKADEMAGLIGSTPAAKPVKGRKVLVFWRCEGFVHGKAIEYGNKALELAAKQTGAYTADFSNDYEVLRAENLAKYDAVVLNNTTGLKTWEQTFIEPALTEYVKSGKGLAVIHAGADNFYKAESAAEMVGGVFWGHPWGAGGTWAFKLDEPGHPLNRVFGGQNFKSSDEIYQQRSPYYNRAKLRVLISLDMSDKATADAKGQQRDDKDFAVSWVRPYGKGRVFYTSFAHDERTYLDKLRLTHILDGVQYAVGDLKVDDTPGGLSTADLERIKGATEESAATVAGYLQDIFANTGHAATDAANKAKIEALLKDPATTVHGRQAILRTLQAFGTTQVGLMVEGLKVAETRDLAAAVLAGIPGSATEKALAQALASGDAAVRGVAVDAAALRGNAGLIVPLLADKDQAVAAQAIAALGRVGDQAALVALSKPAGVAALEPLRQRSLAACMSAVAASGKGGAGAVKVAGQLYKNPAVSEAVRAASAKVLLQGDKGFFAQGMKDSSPYVRKAVIGAADSVPVAALVTALGSATVEDKVALIARLSQRGASESEAAVAAQLNSDNEWVVVEAQNALSIIGSLKSVPALLAQSGEGSDAVKRGAFQALFNYRAAGTGAALIEQAGASEEVQKRVIVILAERSELKLLPKMESFVRSQSVEVRREIWKALGKMCDERGFAQVAGWLPLVQEQEINQAEAAVRAIARNVADGERTAALNAAWEKGGVATKRVVAPLMAGFSDGSFMAKLVAGSKDGDNKVREAVLRALSEWSDVTAFNVLKEAVGSQQDGGLKNTALRGALKVATAHGGGDTRKLLVDLFKGAPDAKGRQQVVEALFRSEGLEVFPLLQGMFNDGAAGAAAKQAYVALYDSSIKDQANIPANEIEPKKWKADASHAGRDAGRAIDRNAGSRWSSNRSSEKGMWFTLDLGENIFVSEVILDTTGSGGDTPNGYEVFTSGDGKNWSGPVAKGDGNHRDKTVIALAVQARHLKFVTTGGRKGLHWSIHEIYAKAGLDKAKAAEIGKVADGLR